MGTIVAGLVVLVLVFSAGIRLLSAPSGSSASRAAILFCAVFVPAVVGLGAVVWWLLSGMLADVMGQRRKESSPGASVLDAESRDQLGSGPPWPLLMIRSEPSSPGGEPSADGTPLGRPVEPATVSGDLGARAQLRR
ncbi:MAG: hypothetical protein ACRDZ5_01645 [Acidimicrobiales bacterium]